MTTRDREPSSDRALPVTTDEIVRLCAETKDVTTLRELATREAARWCTLLARDLGPSDPSALELHLRALGVATMLGPTCPELCEAFEQRLERLATDFAKALESGPPNANLREVARNVRGGKAASLEQVAEVVSAIRVRARLADAMDMLQSDALASAIAMGDIALAAHGIATCVLDAEQYADAMVGVPEAASWCHMRRPVVNLLAERDLVAPPRDEVTAWRSIGRWMAVAGLCAASAVTALVIAHQSEPAPAREARLDGVALPSTVAPAAGLSGPQKTMRCPDITLLRQRLDRVREDGLKIEGFSNDPPSFTVKTIDAVSMRLEIKASGNEVTCTGSLLVVKRHGSDKQINELLEKVREIFMTNRSVELRDLRKWHAAGWSLGCSQLTSAIIPMLPAKKELWRRLVLNPTPDAIASDERAVYVVDKIAPGLDYLAGGCFTTKIDGVRHPVTICDRQFISFLEFLTDQVADWIGKPPAELGPALEPVVTWTTSDVPLAAEGQWPHVSNYCSRGAIDPHLVDFVLVAHFVLLHEEAHARAGVQSPTETEDARCGSPKAVAALSGRELDADRFAIDHTVALTGDEFPIERLRALANIFFLGAALEARNDRHVYSAGRATEIARQIAPELVEVIEPMTEVFDFMRRATCPCSNADEHAILGRLESARTWLGRSFQVHEIEPMQDAHTSALLQHFYVTDPADHRVEVVTMGCRPAPTVIPTRDEGPFVKIWGVGGVMVRWFAPENIDLAWRVLEDLQRWSK